ncbi:MAG TPA: hypothetical protein VK498_05585 [Ferruginibacter sp.]|nr:hypothetical protein [Ferruginibacter sp.]
MEADDLYQEIMTWLESKDLSVFEKYKENIEVRNNQVLVNENNGISELDQMALVGLISTYVQQHPKKKM